MASQSDSQNQQVWFSPYSQYIFVNLCIQKIHNCKLPSYSCYNGNDELGDFWSKLTNDNFKTIYDYLVEIYMIDAVDNPDYKKIVLDFVDNFFIDD